MIGGLVVTCKSERWCQCDCMMIVFVILHNMYGWEMMIVLVGV